MSFGYVIASRTETTLVKLRKDGSFANARRVETATIFPSYWAADDVLTERNLTSKYYVYRVA